MGASRSESLVVDVAKLEWCSRIITVRRTSVMRNILEPVGRKEFDCLSLVLSRSFRTGPVVIYSKDFGDSGNITDFEKGRPRWCAVEGSNL